MNNDAHFEPVKPNFKQLVLLNIQQLTNFPYIEADFDAITNYQLLCKVVEYLNQVITNNNTQNETITDLYDAFVELENYVNNWIDHVDIEEDVNNKLDEMAQDGTLTELIKNYVDPIYQSYENRINTAVREQNETITEQSETINNFTSLVNTEINEINTKVNNLASGSPLVASSTAGMTNTNRVYVNTTDGNWYYYNGTEWVIGGTYQSTGIADESIGTNNLNDELKYNLNSRIIDKDIYEFNGEKEIDLTKVDLINYNTNSYGEITNAISTRVVSKNLIYIPFNSSLFKVSNELNYHIFIHTFDEDLTFIRTFEIQSNLGILCLPKNSKYIRLKIYKSDGSADITPLEAINNVALKFATIFKDNINEKTEDNLLNDYKAQVGFITSASSPYSISNDVNYKTSELIKLKANTSYYISRFRKFALYNLNYEYINNSFIDSDTSDYTFTTSSECYLAISYRKSNATSTFIVEGTSGTYSPYIEKLPPYIQLQNISNLNDIINTANVLYNKKYVALGDSFTHGDFGTATEDDYIQDGIYAGQLKVYPFLIGNRNLMQVSNLAVNGMTLTNINGESNNYLSDSILSNIPSDVDYITIKIGINDNPDHQNAPLGTIDSNDSTTFYGSFNRVMTYLINNFKNAKIGIIVSNGMISEDFVNATINIAKKYGVAYLNETTDNNIPLLIRTLRTDVSSSIKSIRNNEWYVSSTNHHPNAKCHTYESTIVEDFLRRL